MTTEEKKQALIDAGVKVRSNASDETIAEMWETHVTESTADYEPEPVEDVVSVEVEDSGPTGAYAPTSPTTCATGPSDIMEAFAQVLKEHGTKQLGPRTPAVYDWADANLPAEEWNKIYAGKRYNGEILQPKA